MDGGRGRITAQGEDALANLANLIRKEAGEPAASRECKKEGPL